MRIAEIGSTRAMIVLGALSVGALVAATWECATPQRTHDPRPVRPMRGCGQAKARVVTPPAAPHRNGHADALIAAREDLSACMQQQAVAIRLSLDISAEGRVTNTEVKAMSDDLAKLDLRVVKCVNAVVSPLQFPTGTAPVRISTHLAPR
jgi:hypothetical protein